MNSVTSGKPTSLVAYQDDLARKFSSETSGGDLRLVVPFVSSDHLWILPARDVLRVMLPLEITRVPMAPRNVLGLCGMDGSIMTVVDFNGLVGERITEQSPKSKFIVVKAGAIVLCLLVEAVYPLQPLKDFDPSTIKAEIGETKPHGLLIGSDEFPAFPISAVVIARAAEADRE